MKKIRQAVSRIWLYSAWNQIPARAHEAVREYPSSRKGWGIKSNKSWYHRTCFMAAINVKPCKLWQQIFRGDDNECKNNSLLISYNYNLKGLRSQWNIYWKISASHWWIYHRNDIITVSNSVTSLCLSVWLSTKVWSISVWMRFCALV